MPEKGSVIDDGCHVLILRHCCCRRFVCWISRWSFRQQIFYCDY